MFQVVKPLFLFSSLLFLAKPPFLSYSQLFQVLKPLFLFLSSSFLMKPPLHLC
jgi:hypothetical protein